MTLDKVKIGSRIRKVREEVINESRQAFAEKCDISENILGKIERGEILVSMKNLYKIYNSTGVSLDYILLGLENNKKTPTRNNIDFYLDNSSSEELKMYSKIITSIENCIKK